jgi:hypothetical protein
VRLQVNPWEIGGDRVVANNGTLNYSDAVGNHLSRTSDALPFFPPGFACVRVYRSS